jgi:hypothetical protein
MDLNDGQRWRLRERFEAMEGTECWHDGGFFFWIERARR